MKSPVFRFLNLTSNDDGVVDMRLNRPEKRNAFHAEMIDEILECLRLLEDSMDHRILTISGEGKIFCAGGDIGWMHSICSMDEDDRLIEAKRVRALFHTVHIHSRPTIAKVQGGAFGGGVGLAIACDYVVANEDAVFSTSEVRLGIVPACLAPYLVRRIGFSKAKQLFLSASRLDASASLQLGLVDRVQRNGQTIDSEVQSLVETLLQGAPQAQRDSKSLLLNLEDFRGCDQASIDYLSESWGSASALEGTSAFLAKRLPNWIS